jgi:HTH-type transcriptional regulator/antitoxin HigA
MMKHRVRVIKSKADYDEYMSRVSDLMSGEIKAGSEAEAELELLALVISAYERSKVAPVIPDPIEAILFCMDQQKLSAKDLAPLIGSVSKVSEVLSRKRPLSLSMIRAIHKGLGIPAEVLIAGTGENYLDLSKEPQYNFSKFPLLEMLDRGCFPNYKHGAKRIKEYAEELILGFMRDVTDLRTAPALLRAPLQQSGSREMDEYSLLAWRICVLKKSRARTLATKYRSGSLTEDWMRDLAKLSRFEAGPKLAQQHLADAGIALVIEPHYKKTYLDGAAMLDDGKPIVALTLRHDRIDNFWFALLHELVHIDRHLSIKAEAEADTGAREALIPAAEWKKSKVRTSQTLGDALDLANKLRIHPAIVAGRVRFETANWRLLSSLMGVNGDVSKNFEDQLREQILQSS